MFSSHFDIIGLTETWLTEGIWNNEILPNTFNIYRKDRTSRGGGVLLAIRATIPSRELFTPINIEALTIELHLSQPHTLCVVYIPPHPTTGYFDTCLSHLTNLIVDSHPLIILGDFNTPDINWPTLTGISSNASKLVDFIFDHNLSQLIDQPTHICGNILDLVITNQEHSISSLTVNTLLSQSLSTDHYPILLTLWYKDSIIVNVSLNMYSIFP